MQMKIDMLMFQQLMNLNKKIGNKYMIRLFLDKNNLCYRKRTDNNHLPEDAEPQNDTQKLHRYNDDQLYTEIGSEEKDIYDDELYLINNKYSKKKKENVNTHLLLQRVLLCQVMIILNNTLNI
eukprot:155672_1